MFQASSMPDLHLLVPGNHVVLRTRDEREIALPYPLDSWIKSLEASGKRGSEVKVDADEIENLRALGYIR